MVRIFPLFLLFFLSLLASIGGAETGKLLVGNFSGKELQGWESLEFQGKTQYTLREKSKVYRLEANSIASASGLVKKIKIDLSEYPYLNWSWQVVKPLGSFDEHEKSGDDFAARIYVIVKDGIFPWNKKAVNYVWAGDSPKEQSWSSPYAGKRSMMVAVRSKEDVNGRFHSEKRNLYEDMRKFFGEEIRYIDAIALMTDSDDSKRNASTYYGDIYFSKK